MTLRAALLALLLLAPSAALAQTADSARAASADPAPQPAARPSRWATPFSVESTGRPTPHRVQGEVVWAASERPAAEPADSAARDTASTETVFADSAPPLPRTTRADTATTRRATRRDTAAARTATRRDTAGTRAPATRPRTHRVADGETLSGIARRYGVTTAQLRVLNPNDTAGTLEPGMVLRLPPAPRPAGSTPDRPAPDERPPTARTPAERPAARRRTHTVAPRETLFSLARRYGVTTDAIRRANDLPSDQLRAGQTLVIPAP